MNEAFLALYNDELASIRAAAAEFAAEHPRIAGRLRISEDAVEDPFVERMIESFAFLTARVRQKLDDDFPELTDALLGILYPHYQRPIPSMAIVQMEGLPELPEPDLIPAGALLDTEPVEGERCRYSTAYPVALHPIRLREASLQRRPFQAPTVPAAGEALACLRLSLETNLPDLPIAAAAPRVLRLFLRGQPALSYGLYEALLNDTVTVAFAADAGEPAPETAGPDCLRAVGFEPHEGLLPYPDTAHIAYRLLTEYFTFPDKFLFIDLRLPDRLPPGRQLDVFVYLRHAAQELERGVTAEAFALHCTPIVNLFPHAAEPIALNQTTTDCRVVPDSRRVRALEVYAVDRARILGGDGTQREALPFYAIRHADLDHVGARNGVAEPAAWWLAHRTQAGHTNPGSETHLAMVDLMRGPMEPADDVLALDLTCLNRDLPQRLPFGGGHPGLTLVAPRPAVARLRALTAPTPTMRPAFRGGGRWQLVSHLALNHLSMAGPEGLAALREILLLYDLKASAETRALIDGVVGLKARPGTARVRSRSGTAICRGLDVEIALDPARFSGSGVFLMASVLERFLGLYVSVNAFTRLTVTLRGRTGVLRTWPARSGDRILL